MLQVECAGATGLTVHCLRMCADVDRDAILKAPLWELFQLRGAEALPAGLADDVVANREFTINNVMLRAGKGASALGSSLPASLGGSSARSSTAPLFTLGFRWGLNPLLCSISPFTFATRQNALASQC